METHLIRVIVTNTLLLDVQYHTRPVNIHNIPRHEDKVKLKQIHLRKQL
jgi:hypothetical protein